ncbi:MAG TPA: GAF and ANTAR domain-containing protein [Intrasporangium sp.]|nr:GAF and ANTAR domain-containing protein [Intrasporangium sp.]
MHDHEMYLRALSRFSKLLLTSYDVDSVLGELASQCAEILDLVGSGVSLGRGDKVSYATAVPAQVAALEHTQQTTQTGPCVHAYRTGEVVAVDDLADQATTWPEYCRVAREVGIGAVAALPMTLGGQRVGSLDLYSVLPRKWEDEDLLAAGVLADMGTAYLINASQLDRQVQLAGQLRSALDSRVVVEQAKGILANRAGISVDEAFLRIRKHAREHQAKLHEVAAAIVNLGLDL